MSKANITKRAIVSSFKQMVQLESFNKITVTNLCATTGISRRCFYCYFKDVYDVVNWIFYDEFLSKYKTESKILFFNGFFNDLCEYFYNNSKYYCKILTIEGQNSFRDYVSLSFTPLVIDDVKIGIPSEGHARVFINTLIDIGIYSILEWLQSEVITPPEQFVEKAVKLCSNAAYHFGDRASRKK